MAGFLLKLLLLLLLPLLATQSIILSFRPTTAGLTHKRYKYLTIGAK